MAENVPTWQHQFIRGRSTNDLMRVHVPTVPGADAPNRPANEPSKIGQAAFNATFHGMVNVEPKKSAGEDAPRAVSILIRHFSCDGHLLQQLFGLID